MPYPTKKQKVDCYQRDVVVTDNDFVASFDDLSDVLPNIFGFLPINNIMCSRRINKKSREAVLKTIVPPTKFSVDSVRDYNAIRVMTRVLPNLQQIKIGDLGILHNHHKCKWSDGEDPDEEVAAETVDYRAHDIDIISNFTKLRILKIGLTRTSLNGTYPSLFNFPLLEELMIMYCPSLKWDLEMLAGLPSLKKLHCQSNNVTGNISSLRVLKDTLEKVYIDRCWNVDGNFMDLADFPHLKELELGETAVTGDIRDIGSDDFSLLEQITLPKGVYGGTGYEFRRISDGADLINKVYLLKKQRPALKMYDWYVRLSGDSPDWYESAEDYDTPPFDIHFAKAGSRIGYRWTSDQHNPCEVNWLDPEPDRESSDYSEYIEILRSINSQVHMYKGFHQPPTEEEYIRLYEEYAGESDEGHEEF